MNAPAEPWCVTPEGVVIACRLTPRGGRDAIDGAARLADGTSVLMARVRSAPEGGRANKALCALITAKLDAPASSVRLAAGARSRLKQVVVSGDPDRLIARLRNLTA
ncbi:MAG: DUF167 domain-containing protein [Hyphomicrobiales bacterium]|nr:DUF167 domain-containing protein [Hyphomicrobiales bacterium]